MDPSVKVELKKLSSAQLCSSVLGQTCMDAVVNPPKPGEPSYELFMKVIVNIEIFAQKFLILIYLCLIIKEKNETLNSLKEKARLVTEILNQIDGVKCNPVQGNLM